MFFVDRVVGCQRVTHTLPLKHTCALRIEDMVQFGSICQLKKKKLQDMHQLYQISDKCACCYVLFVQFCSYKGK